jgi:hypothetical protein
MITLLYGQYILVGCTSFLQNTAFGEGTNSLTPIPNETLQAFSYEDPIKTKQQAVLYARMDLRTSRLEFTDTLEVVSVDRLRYGDAKEKMKVLGHSQFNETVGNGETVWLVIFKGFFTIHPPDPLHTFTPPPPSLGCAYSLFSSDGDGLGSLGTIQCPP